MCGPLLLLFVGMPALELYSILKVGEEVGAGNTMMLLVFSFFLGLTVIRGQSFAAVQRLRAGIPPQGEVLSGPLLFVAALLFMFPGFVSDAVALPLLLPPIRRLVARLIAKRFGRPWDGPDGPGGSFGGGRATITVMRIGGPGPGDP